MPAAPGDVRTPWAPVLVALSALFTLAYLRVALARMAYPFELEWIEGGLLQATMRVLEHQPLYARPTLEYVAFNYPPLYPWIAALVSRAVGGGFFPLRLVSFAASLGCMALIALLVGRETRSRLAPVLAVGLFAATFRISGAWFDVARADSLYLLLLLGGFVSLRLDASRVRSALVSGVLFSLAFLAKQSAPMVVAPMLLYLLWTDRTRFLVLAAVIAAGIGGSTLWLDHASGGWFRYFLFDAPRHHPMEMGRVLAFWPEDVLMRMGLALLVALAGVGPAAGEAPSRRGFYAAMFAGTAASSWFHRMYPGGYDNVLMPLYATIAILFALGGHEVLRWCAGQAAGVRARVTGMLGIASVLQLVALAYNPLAQVPTRADRATGEQFVAGLRAIPGRVLVASQPYLARRAGKPDHFHEMAFIAVVQDGNREAETTLARDLERAVRDTAYSVVILSSRGWLGPVVQQGYQQRPEPILGDDTFWPVTGMRTRPEYLFLPRRSAPAPAPPAYR